MTTPDGSATATDTTAAAGTAQATTAAGGAGATHASGGGLGAGGAGGRGTPAKLPTILRQGDRDPIIVGHTEGDKGSPWVSYLQQMLNYFYSSEVCNDSGEFDWLTARAVSHFRDQYMGGGGDTVDVAFWNKLGVEDAPDQAHAGGAAGAAHGAGAANGDAAHGGAAQGAGGHQGGEHQQGGSGDNVNIDYPGALVDLPDSSMSWAASLAIVLNSKGNSYTVDTLCEHVQATKEQKSWSEASGIGANQGMSWVNCSGNTSGDWGAALQSGMLWLANPNDDTHMFVVAGIRHNQGEAEIHVLNPKDGNDVWVSMSVFNEFFGMSEGYQGQMLALA